MGAGRGRCLPRHLSASVFFCHVAETPSTARQASGSPRATFQAFGQVWRFHRSFAFSAIDCRNSSPSSASLAPVLPAINRARTCVPCKGTRCARPGASLRGPLGTARLTPALSAGWRPAVRRWVRCRADFDPGRRGWRVMVGSGITNALRGLVPGRYHELAPFAFRRDPRRAQAHVAQAGPPCRQNAEILAFGKIFFRYSAGELRYNLVRFPCLSRSGPDVLLMQ